MLVLTNVVRLVSLPRRRRLQRACRQYQAGPVTYLAMIERLRNGAVRRPRCPDLSRMPLLEARQSEMSEDLRVVPGADGVQAP
jgi:hypothetical protein